MPLNKEVIIQTELNYFKSPLAKEPAFIIGDPDADEYYDREDRCVYLNPEGRKCAVGVLLKPNIYEERFDNAEDPMGVKGLPVNVQEFLGKENIAWLQELQICHDECARSWGDENRYGEHNHFGRWFLEIAKERKLLTA